MMPEEQAKKYREMFNQIFDENMRYRKARMENQVIKDLVAPECKDGYTDEQITRIMGARLYEFQQWMHGQTGAICEGREYNHETQEYEDTGEGPHGYITYRQDVERFLLGLPVVD